ncbi:MAG: STAS domain-containing protein [Candidatus Magnetoovum sp. WYHC-5]|nr:STAS domain-containing protein [Candidatus Magnetoovum sp. WYHC-5]
MVTVDIKSDKLAVVQLSGPLNVGNAVKIKESLVEVFSKAEHVLLDIENAEEVDLSFLQIIRSYIESMRNTQKRLTFIKSCPDVFKQTVENLGMSQHFSFDFANPDEIT